MKWKTAITDVRGGREIVRGHALKDLIQQKSFVEVVYLILRGEFPTQGQTRMLNAMFTACIDHGVGVSSAMVARLVASSGNSLHTALASGILAFGSLHGGAAEDAAYFFSEHKNTADIDALIKTLREKKVRIPGYGHKILSHDPRSDVLFAIARETGIYDAHCEFAERVHTALNAISLKRLPLNIDGALAAILLDMGFVPKIANGLFIIGRVPGLVAHIIEEMKYGEGLRRLGEDEIEYIGEKPIE